MAAQQYHFDAVWPIQKLGQVSSEKDTTEDHVVEAGTCMLPSVCSAGILGPGFVPWP